ncbi:uncharacterized protein MONOS_17403 [Monocercomonoides exilis]|uniref:uncharacterized protein n=1 Tax=Monocercomonoides exilis TaxID=2049356 RepID=UPI00355A9066|nr:hypothetical protein MONOS_17403 [Monocercomonoides exilis]
MTAITDPTIGGAVRRAGVYYSEASCGRDDTPGRDDEHHVYWRKDVWEEREEKREGVGTSRNTMDEFVAIGAVVPQESVQSIALRDATYTIRQVCHGKAIIGMF